MNLTGQQVKDAMEYSYGGWFNQMTSENDHLISFKTDAAGNLIYRLGGNNIADNINSAAKDNSGFVPLSMEYIATQNPEVIFIVTHGDPGAVKTELDNTLGENPLWQDVAAVKNGRVYVLPYQLFAVNPGTRIAEALNILADDMYEKE